MQFRMVARRIPSGSMTVLGDLAQATGPWTYDCGTTSSSTCPIAATCAARNSPSATAPPDACSTSPPAAPGGRPGDYARPPPSGPGARSPHPRRVDPADLLTTALAKPRCWPATMPGGAGRPHRARAQGPFPADPRPPRRRRPRARRHYAPRHRGWRPRGQGSRIRFAVVVVEPAAIAGTEQRGLRLLYVAMTRPIQHLSIVHAEDLPPALLG
jgi:hypothetical protein